MYNIDLFFFRRHSGSCTNMYFSKPYREPMALVHRNRMENAFVDKMEKLVSIRINYRHHCRLYRLFKFNHFSVDFDRFSKWKEMLSHQNTTTIVWPIHLNLFSRLSAN